MSSGENSERVSFSSSRWLRKRAGVMNFRLHDFRHTFATRLLRKTGNIKLVQKALNHSDIRTTTKYAHVLDDEVGAAMEREQKSPRWNESPTTSPPHVRMAFSAVWATLVGPVSRERETLCALPRHTLSPRPCSLVFPWP